MRSPNGARTPRLLPVGLRRRPQTWPSRSWTSTLLSPPDLPTTAAAVWDVCRVAAGSGCGGRGFGGPRWRQRRAPRDRHRRLRRRDLSTGKLTIERVYLSTSLDVFDATPAELAAWIRGHWGTENLLHHVRDRTFREDDSKIRTGALPRTQHRRRPSATPSATTPGPYEPSDSPDEPGQISITQWSWVREYGSVLDSTGGHDHTERVRRDE